MIEFLHNTFKDDFTITDYFIFIGVLLTALVSIVGLAFKRLKDEQKEIVEKHLSTQESIDDYTLEIHTKLPSDKLSLYKTYLKSMLDFLQSFFGELKVFSYKALDRHILLSLIYSFSFFYLVWLFGGSGNSGNIEVLPNENRVIISIFLFFEIVFIYYLFSNLERIKNYLMNLMNLMNKISFLKNRGVVLVVVVVVVVVAVAVIIHLLVVLLGGGVGVLVGVFGVGVFGVLVVVGVLLGVGILLGGGVVGVVGVGVFGVLVVLVEGVLGGVRVGENIVYLLFFFILPIINAFYDYISMYFSRLFAQNIYNTQSKTEIVIEVIVDLFIAVILLISLAYTIYEVIGFFNEVIIKNSKYLIPIDYYKDLLCIDPFDKDVLWITMMFISTLIPTMIHILLAIYAILANIITKPHMHIISDQLKEILPNDGNSRKQKRLAKSLARYELAGEIKLYLFSWTIVFTLLIVTILMILMKKGLYLI